MDCKAVAGEHVTTQHKPVVFVVRMQKKKQIRPWAARLLSDGGAKTKSLLNTRSG